MSFCTGGILLSTSRKWAAHVTRANASCSTTAPRSIPTFSRRQPYSASAAVQWCRSRIRTRLITSRARRAPLAILTRRSAQRCKGPDCVTISRPLRAPADWPAACEFASERACELDVRALTAEAGLCGSKMLMRRAPCPARLKKSLPDSRISACFPTHRRSGKARVTERTLSCSSNWWPRALRLSVRLHAP